MADRIPIVDYLVIDDGQPYLRARECADCHALFLDRRNACARCGGESFTDRRLGTTGALRSFTVVYRAAPGVPVPYASLLVDLDGGGVVKGNLLGTDPRPEQIALGSRLRLGTWIAGTDAAGTEAVAFGFALA